MKLNVTQVEVVGTHIWSCLHAEGKIGQCVCDPLQLLASCVSGVVIVSCDAFTPAVSCLLATHTTCSLSHMTAVVPLWLVLTSSPSDLDAEFCSTSSECPSPRKQLTGRAHHAWR